MGTSEELDKFLKDFKNNAFYNPKIDKKYIVAKYYIECRRGFVKKHESCYRSKCW